MQPVTPALDWLFRAEVRIDAPRVVGPVHAGTRRVIPIIGGHFEGEHGLSGEVLPGGADWQIVHADGSATLEAKYTLQSHSGALIDVHNVGLRHGPPAVMARLAAGEAVSPEEYYFRTTPRFETGDPDLAWLNRCVAVCSALRRSDAVVLDFYRVS